MNNLNKSFLMAAVACIMLRSAAVYGKSDKHKQDPLVGTWLANTLISTDVPTFAVVTFHSDGTVDAHSSNALQRPIPGLAPAGLYITEFLGIWEKICKGRYRFAITAVINQKDITTRNDCGDLLFAGIPFARFRGIYELELLENGDRFALAGSLHFYAVDDITLSGPEILPPVVETDEAARLKFPEPVK